MSFQPKLAVVHEWLDSYAGSEKVVEQLLHSFPQAELYALVDFLAAKDRGMLLGREIHTSFIQRLPLAHRLFRNYLPLMPLAVEQFDLADYDVILSSSHAVAKGVLTRNDQLHISYVHTPIRYAWDLHHQYLREAKLTWGLQSLIARLTLHYLRLWDRASADRVDVFVANSRYVAARIEKTYRREAQVIYPPVDVDSFTFQERKEDFYLAASRLVPYKRVDVIVEAFRLMPSRKLVVIGDGPQLSRLKKRATANIELLGFQDNATLQSQMASARAFVFAADEDFGIMPVESQACGTPVIAFGRGGTRETVIAGQTGCFFESQTPEAIVSAVEQFESESFDSYLIRGNAERFSTQRFRREIEVLVSREYEQFQARWRGLSVVAPDHDQAARA
ncbi:MAG: glycosyltransferase family 4 protein [Pirellulaceae bacterium]|nr:glycosyltransferase family 4 protein [Pirellulaceae bacterium]